MNFRKTVAATAVAAGLAVAAPALAVANPMPYSGGINLKDLHIQLSDYKRMDEASGSDSLFGSTSMQEHPTIVFNTLEISIMDAGEPVDNKQVNGRDCPSDTDFQVFVSPVATCSSTFGRNFSGFRAQAEIVEGEPDKWKPMLYMNVGGRWKDLSKDKLGDTPTGEKQQDEAACRKVLVQKICQ